jgi:outer membrane receptor protein involved in Fe transport
VVVSASRAEQQVIDASATVTVVTAETIRKAPSVAIGDLLRVVPGVNVAQLSARDVNITTRSASSALATSQLALVDGRTIYLDFFGMVMWDLVPTDPNDIRRIEVIRGPASAVWGANALSGLVNVVTKSPRESAASGARTTLTMSAGTFNRDVEGRDDEAGSLFTVNATHSRAVDDVGRTGCRPGIRPRTRCRAPLGCCRAALRIPCMPIVIRGSRGSRAGQTTN